MKKFFLAFVLIAAAWLLVSVVWSSISMHVAQSIFQQH
jgi:hypothetical protein